tara:strand:+ start:719 stop:1915 length:1197 start_codon:yes stop_codon:yes gene_type:complete
MDQLSFRHVVVCIALVVAVVVSWSLGNFPRVENRGNSMPRNGGMDGKTIPLMDIWDAEGNHTALEVTYWDAEKGNEQYKSWGDAKVPRTISIAVDQQATFKGRLATAINLKCNVESRLSKRPQGENYFFGKTEIVKMRDGIDGIDRIDGIDEVLIVAISTDLSNSPTKEARRCKEGEIVCNGDAVEAGLDRIQAELWDKYDGKCEWLLPELLTGYMKLDREEFYIRLRKFLTKRFKQDSGSGLPNRIRLLLFTGVDETNKAKQAKHIDGMIEKLHKDLGFAYRGTSRKWFFPMTLGIAITLGLVLMVSYRRRKTQQADLSWRIPNWNNRILHYLMLAWFLEALCLASVISNTADVMIGASRPPWIEFAFGSVAVLLAIQIPKSEKAFEEFVEQPATSR